MAPPIIPVELILPSGRWFTLHCPGWYDDVADVDGPFLGLQSRVYAFPSPAELAAWCASAPRWAHDLGAGARWDYVQTWPAERFEPGPAGRYDLREPAPGDTARVFEDLLTATTLESATAVPAEFDALVAGDAPAPPEPASPEPASPEPASPEPASPEPAPPEPARPEPAPPEPAQAEPRRTDELGAWWSDQIGAIDAALGPPPDPKTAGPDDPLLPAQLSPVRVVLIGLTEQDVLTLARRPGPWSPGPPAFLGTPEALIGAAEPEDLRAVLATGSAPGHEDTPGWATLLESLDVVDLEPAGTDVIDVADVVEDLTYPMVETGVDAFRRGYELVEDLVAWSGWPELAEFTAPGSALYALAHDGELDDVADGGGPSARALRTARFHWTEVLSRLEARVDVR